MFSINWCKSAKWFSSIGRKPVFCFGSISWDWQTEKIIKKLSDRRSGAGCDQLITINSAPNDIDAAIEIFNPNGDKAEACGNGTRCVAKLLLEENKKNSINILSDAGVLNASYKDGNNISVNMGKLYMNWKKIPLAKKIDTMNMRPIYDIIKLHQYLWR